MKKLKPILVLVALLLTITSVAAAPSNIDTTDQESTNDVTNVEIEQTNFLQNILRSSLSVVALQEEAAPGETVTFETLNTLNQDVEADELDFNIDIIYCGTECTDPPTGSCSEIGDVPQGEEDCIAHNVIDYDEATGDTLESGTTYWTSFDYRIPRDAPEGKYLVQSFLYERGDDTLRDTSGIVSDFSNDYFTVSTSTDDTGDDTDNDGTTDPSVDEPRIEAYQPPRVTVEGNTVKGTVYLENTGGDMTSSNIVEMQVKTPQNQFLSYISGQSTCDPSHPATVNKEFVLDNGERVAVNLQSQELPDGRYDIVFVTATGCTDEGGELVQPYSSSTDNYRETVTVGEEDDSGQPVLPVALGILGLSILGVVLYRSI